MSIIFRHNNYMDVQLGIFNVPSLRDNIVIIYRNGLTLLCFVQHINVGIFVFCCVYVLCDKIEK